MGKSKEKVQPEDPNMVVGNICRVTGLPIIAIIVVDGRKIPVSSSRPYNREFLLRWVYDCARNPKMSFSEYVEADRKHIEKLIEDGKIERHNAYPTAL